MLGKTEAPANKDAVKERDRWSTTDSENSVGHKNMQQLIQLRWIAVVGQITTIAVVTLGLGIELPVRHMLEVLVCLVAFNIASHLRWHERPRVSNSELFLALLVDVAILTAQLYLSGGTTNPFIFLYLLQVILSAVLLEAWSTWIIVAITSACLVALSILSSPLTLPYDHEYLVFSMYVQGVLICFSLNAILLAFFITRINRNLRTGATQLADLRKRATEEENIVRMGLLASGAAHELGTPLATLSVILGDWRRMPEFTNNPELRAEIVEMETQLKRCKAIVSSILLSAGEARGESSVKTTLNTFLNDLAAEWRSSRAITYFEYKNRIEQDVPVVFDSVLKQMICNVLDNAVEASPHWVRLEVSSKEDVLTLLITDAGPGFPPDMLSQIGKPYQSTKGRPGSGLGLFLVVNVARKLGGTVAARNRKEGGAAVELTLPLSAISLDEDDEDVG
ncbi:ATP-binding protein [Herminiimonas contaminans]|uniref:histidine kinase n=1 Tax=Herminiimonas contaminans TaxID=1111140 RepID=A0ABS0EW42_9BURK|nr:ATP-binding protein [Herminiimonas contaminans]MBF8179056.1 HAMP domain-containing histidine kinase [Herminiimonas contaminans]